MGTERRVLDNVKYEVAVAHNEQINPWFEYGTVWCDGITSDVADTIKTTLESNFNSEIKVSKLKAKNTEPWDQYAFDIGVPKNG